MTAPHYFVDLFAGCGGLSLGLEQAGFEPIAFTEISEEARETYLTNRPHLKHLKNRWTKDTWDLVENDGRLLKKFLRQHKIKSGELDLIVGGPPCQGYSRLGIRRTRSHDRDKNPGNFLYEAMAEAIEIARPKLFLFENVEGLLQARWKRSDHRGNKGEVFEDVLSSFLSIASEETSDPAYEIRWRLIKSYHYGVPQNRPRVLIVGIRRDLHNQLDLNESLFPMHAVSDSSRKLAKQLVGHKGDGFHPEPQECPPPTVVDAIDDLIDHMYPRIRNKFESTRDRSGLKSTRYRRKPKSDFQEQMRSVSIPELVDFLEWDPSVVHNHEYSYHSDPVVARFKQIQEDGKPTGELKNKKFNQRVLPKVWPDHKPNITVTSMPDDYVHYKQARALTVREWARLQTFPDWYQFKGRRTTGGLRRAGDPAKGLHERMVPQYTQIGNAVPPVLGNALGKHFKTLLSPSPVVTKRPRQLSRST